MVAKAGYAVEQKTPDVEQVTHRDGNSFRTGKYGCNRGGVAEVWGPLGNYINIFCEKKQDKVMNFIELWLL
jgi:hypothetical protein